MVTRVDKKPIIYNTSLIRVWKPSIVSTKRSLIEAFVEKSRGYKVPTVNIRELLEDYEDIETGVMMYGINDPAFEMFTYDDDDEDDETMRIARMCVSQEQNIRKLFRSQAMMDEVSGIQRKVIQGVSNIYYGTEAVYKVFALSINDGIFKRSSAPRYQKWATDTAKKVLLFQSTYMMLHPTAMAKVTDDMAARISYETWTAWGLYKSVETLALKVFNRKNLLAHAYMYGINKKGFDPAKNREEDFEINIEKFVDVISEVKVHIILGMKYITVGDSMYILSADDCINLATMAQCFCRTAMYFSTANGFQASDAGRALSIIKDISIHACRLIDAGKNFSHIIRSIHILSQGEFNDTCEEDFGVNLGWTERSENYAHEAHILDPMGRVFFDRIMKLARNRMDRLNVSFLYHVFIGDEMLLTDLRDKVKAMPGKVLDADPGEWRLFIRFSQAYFLTRFITVNKRKPSCDGNIALLNEQWAEKCLKGIFTMPPQTSWGEVWISGEFSYTSFADTWHLEAQDVAYVVKDSKGLKDGKYRDNREINSELLMAMKHGNVLDVVSGSTPKTARDRVKASGETREVVLTTAPKAENAKPSWKKRVTFAADCEFRKLQAEYDRNCRKVMSFIRGPSLGVDQCVLEKQFSDISKATLLGTTGGICSHDISAWSESMDRKRKFEFEKVLIDMLDQPDMINISKDWDKIVATVLKQGCKDVIGLSNGSFQGFDGSASTILHTMILLYCIDSARRKTLLKREVRTNMATLIDDCIALMENLTNTQTALEFWDHLKETYAKLGFIVDDLKSVFSTIKAIYLSRRFLLGSEVPADLKVYIKAHISYEDPLRCSLDAPTDIMGAMRGAADANGDAIFIYFTSVLSVLCEIAHSNTCVLDIPSGAAAIFSLAPSTENGWGISSIVDWATNDIVDKRSHFNAILEALSVHACQSDAFRGMRDDYTRDVGAAILAIKCQAWRMVSFSNIFTNPFEALREGPMKPDMLKRNAVQDILRDIVTAEPWKSLLAWNVSSTTEKVRELLISSGPLHAPTLAALVNCMPDNYRLSLVGKAIGSQSLLDLLPKGARSILKRRVGKCSAMYFDYTKTIFRMTKGEFRCSDFSAINYIDRAKMEREEFFTANAVDMTDHTFPDPVATMTVSSVHTRSVCSPNLKGLDIWDRASRSHSMLNEMHSSKGIYVPRRSGRVWEITSEYAKGWDTVSQRIAMGLAVLARARADGHSTDGLLVYFTKAWNELSNITPGDTHLISIHGSIKRLDANPGSSTHPIVIHRNILKGLNNTLKTAVDAIPGRAQEMNGSTANLHDPLAIETSILAVTAINLACFYKLGVADERLSHHMAVRADCVVPESNKKMRTGDVYDRICVEIMDGEDNYGLLQACPELAAEIAIPTMKSSWTTMVNALIDCDHGEVERLRKEAQNTPLDVLLHELHEAEVEYTASVIIASAPADRGRISSDNKDKYVLLPAHESSRTKGDSYTVPVRTVGSRFSRDLLHNQPEHISAAVAIKSIVWSRFKDRNARELAKIFYDDPDKDNDVVRECKSENFWRGVVTEVYRMKKSIKLSEMCMRGFKSLGVPDVHIKASDDITAVTKSVASYFGSHLRKATELVSDEITSRAGRSAKDFARPLTERIVTNNPSLHNAKMRKEHMSKLIEFNRENLRERLQKIDEGTVTHRGDRRALEVNRRGRIVDLRCRRYVYLCTNVTEEGHAYFDEDEHGALIHKCAQTVADRLNEAPIAIPDAPHNLSDTLEFMATMERFYRDKFRGKNSGWNLESGSIGTRLAYDTIRADSKLVNGTIFAVSAAELAPKVHRRIIITPEGTPVVPSEALEPQPLFDINDDDMWGGEEMGEDDAGFGGVQGDKISVSARLPIKAWKAVFMLLYHGNYNKQKVESALGIKIEGELTVPNLVNVHLEDFEDDVYYDKIPNLMGDYIGSGLLWTEDFISQETSDAYTTDELGKYPGSFLF